MGSRSSSVYVISKSKLEQWANVFLAASSKFAFGGMVKYALKANPHPEIIKFFAQKGIGIDASSFYEAELALDCGVEPSNISLTSQELPTTDEKFKKIVEAGVWFNATSIYQLEEFCRLFPGCDVGVRLNPGMGSGFNNRNTTGGVSAGFGIWHEYIPELLELSSKSQSKVKTLHTHIGTGTDPKQWLTALEITLGLADKLPDVDTVSIGGGFKASYMSHQKDADMLEISDTLASELTNFYQKTGRKLKLEIEPGRLLVVHAGSIITKIIDKTDTGDNGYNFLRVNTGMTEILRPAMYGAQHKLVVVPASQDQRSQKTNKFVVVGHCCESSDCLTMADGNPEEISPRELQEPMIGDYLVIEQAGAYCYGMSAVGYNSYPRAEVVFID
jgi:diaminopimelate decarboxylase